MSSFFALFQKIGTLNTGDSIDCMRSQMRVYPYDTENVISNARIVTGQATRWYCARDKAATTPLSLSINGIELIFAGNCHLANHKALAKTLSLTESASDAEIICHAYVFYGNQFAEHLLGDFSFALFNAQKAELLLVRDHLGIKPLYFHINDEFCLASDSLDVILAHPLISTKLDDKVVAEWCTNGAVFNQRDTFFASIKKVPRATVLRISSDAIQAIEYWNIDNIKPLVYANEQDYVEQLQTLLDTVITRDIDTTYPIGAHSSGGLDSAAIAVMAGRVCRENGKAFHTYNWCKPNAGDEIACHEWDHARKISQIEEFIHHETGIDAASLKQSLLHHDLAIDGTTLFNYEWPVLLQARQDGIRQIFSGFGGDEVLTSRFSDKHFDEIRAGRFVHAFKRLSLEYDPQKKLRPLRLSMNYARLLYRSLLPQSIRRQAWVKAEHIKLLTNSEFISSEFSEFAKTQYRPNTHSLANTISAQQRYLIALGYHQERLESWAILGRKAGVRYLYPYLDKRIVEFALAIPSELYFKYGKPRHLYLQATKNILPDFLNKKAKLPESYRVEQLFWMRRKLLVDPDVQSMISLSDSPYINAKALLEKCINIPAIKKNNWKDGMMPTAAIINAVLALNVNKKRQQS
ncbi:MAG: asparagine synthase-related protein [Pseudomonadota bacterium]